MSNTALINLQTAINNNTLSAAQQAALSAALDLLIPTFPPPSAIHPNPPFSDEVFARDWLAAIYEINESLGPPPMTATLQTPNTETQFLASEAPGPGGAVLALLDFTPTRTGKMRISVTVALNSSAVDDPTVSLIYIDNLTAVGGGTLIAPGITAGPSSVTPAVGSGVSMCALAQPTFVESAVDVGIVVLASIPLQAVVGHRTGVAVVIASPASATYTNIAAIISVDEQ